tara:strand:- start:310 stop:495 length:186 start_codon:yes stop_codon:yes gene_type:complete
MNVQEYRVLPNPFNKKTKSGIENLFPKHLVKVSNRAKEGENLLNYEGESFSYAVYKGLPRW